MMQFTTSAMAKAARWVGPGFLVAVAYIDPGNYSTDVSAGATTRFQLLFVVLLSNVFAVLLQSLAVRLGTVTGKNLAENCREHLPKWLNWILYLLAESAVVATDVAEVIGSAIAINLLIPAIPLVACCAITLVDVLLILLFYNPDKGMRGLRFFEFFVVGLVTAVVVCFCIQLSLIQNTSIGEVFRGYLPSAAVVDGNGLYLSCGIIGATVMPHSLYLGSGIVQPRVREYDETHQELHKRRSLSRTLTDGETKFQPSLAAIQHCLRCATIELAVSLCVFALFVNSAILIVSGAQLSDNPKASSGDLFAVFHLLSDTIAPGAGILFAVALLFSGISAGIVCTIAGQMVSEGHFQWSCAPWIRRLITRTISIIPSVIIAAAVGKSGLSAALNGSQVTLSILLPFVSAPLVYFTCLNRYMRVETEGEARSGIQEENCNPEDSSKSEENTKSDGAKGGVLQDAPRSGRQSIGMRNHIAVSIFAVLIWLAITIMDIALLVFLGMGQGSS